MEGAYELLDIIINTYTLFLAIRYALSNSYALYYDTTNQSAIQAMHGRTHHLASQDQVQIASKPKP